MMNGSLPAMSPIRSTTGAHSLAYHKRSICSDVWGAMAKTRVPTWGSLRMGYLDVFQMDAGDVIFRMCRLCRETVKRQSGDGELVKCGGLMMILPEVKKKCLSRMFWKGPGVNKYVEVNWAWASSAAWSSYLWEAYRRPIGG